MSSMIPECPNRTTHSFSRQRVSCRPSNSISFNKDVYPSEQSSVGVNLFSMKFSTMRYLYIILALLFSTISYGQIEISNGCGQNRAIQTFMRGINGTTSNGNGFIEVDQTPGFTRGVVEFWFRDNECNGSFPSSIQLVSNAGETRTANRIPVQNPSGSTGQAESIYRATFNQPFTRVEVASGSGCDRVTSAAAYIEREEFGSASFLMLFNRELHGEPTGGDDCVDIVLPVGAEQFERDFMIMLPIQTGVTIDRLYII